MRKNFTTKNKTTNQILCSAFPPFIIYSKTRPKNILKHKLIINFSLKENNNHSLSYYASFAILGTV